VAGEAEFGVLIGSTGIGMSIAANKVAGARAAVVADLLGARLSRQRYDVNILCLGAALLGEEAARHCVSEFLDTPFVAGADGRYRRQISRLHEIERRRP
jgi:ribose 5-phosphate isomerase B